MKPGQGDAKRRLAALKARLAPCTLCPRFCRVDRPAGRIGFCGAGTVAVVSSAGPHFGEESCLVGRGGSGTIFLAGCNLGCVFCQNADISRAVVGRDADTPALAHLMLSLQERGCENVNLVTPTHFTAALAEAVLEARRRGLAVPIVWNSGGYELADVLRLLDGLVEIYMPDFKFARRRSADRYCRAPDYPDRAREALREMHRQVGDLSVEGGVARRGLLVRHLVMPGHAAETREVLDFLAREISADTFVNVMGQYRPLGDLQTRQGRAQFAEIAMRPTPEEIEAARNYARRLGLRLAD
jgi:putative pyruvate formate lyase activating enzyme